MGRRCPSEGGGEEVSFRRRLGGGVLPKEVGRRCPFPYPSVLSPTPLCFPPLCFRLKDMGRTPKV
jgi:hypothetical protein